MKRFELVPHGNGRYSWRFVVAEGRRPRVLAHSTRTYRSPARAKRAIRRLQKADPTIEPTVEPLTLPATDFELLPHVLPLPVEEHHLDDESREVAQYRATPAVAVAPAAAAVKTPKRAAAAKKAK